MKHDGKSRIVRCLPPGTKLTALNDDNEQVSGEIEKYVVVEYTRENGETSHDISYLVMWSDKVYEWISWSEVNTYNPVKPSSPVRERQIALAQTIAPDTSAVMAG